MWPMTEGFMKWHFSSEVKHKMALITGRAQALEDRGKTGEDKSFAASLKSVTFYSDIKNDGKDIYI